MQVGEIYKTKNWGDVEVIEYKDCKNVTVKFLNTDNIRVFRATEISTGNIRDKEALESGIMPFVNPQKGIGALVVGDLYDSNFYGKAKVLEYHGSVHVVIEFVNTGNQYKVQKDALVKGLVKDSILERQINAKIASDRAAEQAKRNRIRCEQEKAARDARTFAELSKREQADIKRAKRKDEKFRKEQKSMSIVYTTEFGGDYSISKIISSERVEVTFKNTGCIVKTTKESIRAGKVKDKSLEPVYTEEELLLKRSESAAKSYQKNREVRLQQAKDYQKNNPDKSRLRNRNRRAKRKNAEGTHTQDEIDLIYQEQGGKCAGCSCQLDDTKHLDHFMPLDLGGSNSEDNLQWLCQFCNNSKSAKEPSLWLYTIGTPEYQARRAAALAY